MYAFPVDLADDLAKRILANKVLNSRLLVGIASVASS